MASVTQFPAPTIRPLAAFAADVAWEGIPADVRERTRDILLDATGVVIAGTQSPVYTVAKSTLEILGPGGGSRILGTPWRAGASVAALVLGLFEMALNFEPVGPEGHVPATAVPAVLSLLDTVRCSGRDLLAAVAVGLEVGGRIGRAMRRIPAEARAELFVRGNPHTVFGAAVAAGRLLRLSAVEMEYAIAIAGYQAMPATLRQSMHNLPIPVIKYDNLPVAAQMGVQAAAMAKAGATGDVFVLDGPTGFWRFTGHPAFDPDKVLADLGEEWMLPTTLHKLYPGSMFASSAMQAAVDLVREHGVDPATIQELVVRFPYPTPAHATRNPSSWGDVGMSVPANIACALWDIHPYASRCRLEVLTDPKVRQLVRRIEVQGLETPRRSDVAAEGYAPAQVRLVTDDGRTYESARDFLPAVTPEDLLQKFEENAAPVLGEIQSRALLRTLCHLDEVADARALLDGGCPAPAGS